VKEKSSPKKEKTLQGKLFYDQKYGIKYYAKNRERYDLEVSPLSQVSERKSYGIYPIEGFLVKFAQVVKKKFFSYEIRFTPVAIKELGIEASDDLETKSTEMAIKILEQGCRDDMIVTRKHADEYVAQSSEQSLPKHRLHHRYKS